MSTKINLTKELQKVLIEKGIDPKTGYRPAYNGKSVGLDLYNASDETFLIHVAKKMIPDINGEEPTYEKVLIPTGVRAALDFNKMGFIAERGSIVKGELVKRAGVIDPEYTDEIFVSLACIDPEIVYSIGPGEKLPVQLIVVPVDSEYETVDDNEYTELTKDSERRNGKIGSSDTK